MGDIIRGASWMLAASLLTTVPQTALAAPTIKGTASAAPKAQRASYERGRQAFESESWVEAADAWSEVLDATPENLETRRFRMVLVVDTMVTYQAGYEATQDPAHLQTALDVYYRYFTAFKAAYDSPNIPRPVVLARFDLKAALEQVEDRPPAAAAAPGPAAEPEPAPSPELEPEPAAPIMLDEPQVSSRKGIGLIIGGAVTLAASVGAASMIAIGSISAQRAREDSSNPDFSDAQRDRIDDEGRRANALLIAGSVVAPVLLGAGATMLGLGLHRHRKRGFRASLAPAWSPRFTGVQLQGRF